MYGWSTRGSTDNESFLRIYESKQVLCAVISSGVEKARSIGTHNEFFRIPNLSRHCALSFRAESRKREAPVRITNFTNFRTPHILPVIPNHRSSRAAPDPDPIRGHGISLY